MNTRQFISMTVFAISMLFAGNTGSVLAARLTASDSANPAVAAKTTSESTATDKKIEDLKERLATKVAELTQSKKIAVFGTIKTVSITTLTLETKNKDYKIELNDDIKVVQYIKSKRTLLTTDDLAKGDSVVVFGSYDITLDVLKAKVIYIQEQQPQTVYGRVDSVDKKDYSIAITTKSDVQYTIDYESVTRTNLWSSEGKLEKSGFSRIKPGTVIVVSGYAVPKKENRVSALRIIDLVMGVEASPTAKNTPVVTQKMVPKSETPNTTTSAVNP